MWICKSKPSGSLAENWEFSFLSSGVYKSSKIQIWSFCKWLASSVTIVVTLFRPKWLSCSATDSVLADVLNYNLCHHLTFLGIFCKWWICCKIVFSIKYWCLLNKWSFRLILLLFICGLIHCQENYTKFSMSNRLVWHSEFWGIPNIDWKPKVLPV